MNVERGTWMGGLLKVGMMNKSCIVFSVSFYFIASLGLAADKSAEQPAVNLLGYPGMLVVPAAYTSGDGVITPTFSRIPKLYAAKLQPYRMSSVLAVNVGVLPFLEGFIAMVRPDHFTGGTGDRTAGLRLNLLREKTKRPAITVGVQDFFAAKGIAIESDAPQVFSSLYLVGSKKVAAVNNRHAFIHLGYGVDWLPANTYQLVGLFGGVEMQIHSGFYFLLENDAKKWNVGLRSRVWNRLQLMIGWWGWDRFCCNVSTAIDMHKL